MSTVELIAGTFILTVLIVSPVCIALIVSRSLSRSFASADRRHETMMGMLQESQDRIMAVDYSQFVAWKSAAESDAGGFFAPADQDEGVETVAPRWGAGSPVRVRLATLVDGDIMPGEDEEPAEEVPGVPGR